MPRFVILLHELPPGTERATHWDFMLEQIPPEGGTRALRTWALAEEPAAGKAIAAETLPDHRIAYLTYEGEVSGNRGRVTRWEEGEYEVVSAGPPLRIVLRGRRVSGTAVLEERQWRFY